MIQGEKTLRKDALVSYLSGGFKESSIVTQVTNGACKDIHYRQRVSRVRRCRAALLLRPPALTAHPTTRRPPHNPPLLAPPRSSSLTGKNAMPAFGGRLGDDEIGDVAAYVYDQASGDKWD